ncbi:hypothetical protein As57867_021111, partial [Aphanomyces stellatus]
MPTSHNTVSTELRLEIRQAKNLPSVSMLGKPNPFCKVVLGEQTHTTKGSTNARAPSWNETFTLSLSSDSAKVIHINIMDPNYIKNNGIIAAGEFSIDKIIKDKSIDEWVDMRANNKAAGQIHIVGEVIVSNQPTTTPTPKVTQQKTSESEQHSPNKQTPQVYELNVKVLQAKDLHNAEMFGKQDPFCKVTIGDKTFQTRVHQDGGRNPKWDEAFVFRLPNPHLDQLTVQIEDSGMIANSIIGTCQLPVSIWTSGRAVEQWYPVNHGNKQRG